MATKTSHESNCLALSVLLGLVDLVCRNSASVSTVSISQVLSLVPPLQIIRTACNSLPRVTDIEVLHDHLASSQFCAAALSLLQQLAVCASIKGLSQQEDIFAELLALHKALSASTNSSKVPSFGTRTQFLLEANSMSVESTSVSSKTPGRPGVLYQQSGTKEDLSKSRSNSTAGQKRAHNDRGNGQPLLRAKAAHADKAKPARHTSTGQRLRPAIMQIQVLRILSVLLSIPKPPTQSIVAVITTQHARLQQLLSKFNGFLFDEELEGVYPATMSCLSDHDIV